jgi:hypothetical protein
MKILTSLIVATSLFGWFKQDRVTVKPDQMVCLPSSVCVPVSVLETEFKGYEDGQPAPALLLRQQVIDANRMFAAELEQKSMLQGQIGPLQAQINSQRLQQAQDTLDAELAASCGKELAWDKQQRRCLPKPKKDGGQ